MNHYTVTALPGLPALGGAPPLSQREVLEHVRDTARAEEAVRLLLLGQDLRLRDAFLSGEVEHPEPAVLDVAQVKGEAPLPPELDVSAKDVPPREAMEATWAAYFRHAAARAEALPSPFLVAWLRHEVGLRNALSRARAQSIGADVGSSQLAVELGDDAPHFTQLVGQWSATTNQLAATRLLDGARLQWIDAHAPVFSFDDDELVAWAARLLIVQRWHRVGVAPDALASASSSPVQGAPT